MNTTTLPPSIHKGIRELCKKHEIDQAYIPDIAEWIMSSRRPENLLARLEQISRQPPPPYAASPPNEEDLPPSYRPRTREPAPPRRERERAITRQDVVLACSLRRSAEFSRIQQKVTKKVRASNRRLDAQYRREVADSLRALEEREAAEEARLWGPEGRRRSRWGELWWRLTGLKEYPHLSRSQISAVRRGAKRRRDRLAALAVSIIYHEARVRLERLNRKYANVLPPVYRLSQPEYENIWIL